MNNNWELLEERNKLVKRNIERIKKNEKSQGTQNCEEVMKRCQQNMDLVQSCVKQISFEPYQFLLLFGMGNGRLISEISKCMQDGSILMVYEPCKEVFIYNMEQDEFGEILKNDKVLWIIQDVNDSEFVYVYGENMQDVYLNRTLLMEHPYYHQFAREKEKFMGLIEQGRDYHQTLNNSRKLFSKECFENVIHGVWKLDEVKSIEELKAVIPKDTFVVLVAAGPSLKEAIPVLKEYREKYFLVAVYRAVDYLVENGIIPDVIATIDYQQEISQSECKEIHNIPIILPEHAAPRIWDSHKGVKFLASYGAYCKSILEQSGIQMQGYLLQPSVAVWQLAIMIEFGVKKIALVGQDLAYRDGESHVGNVKETKYNTGKMLKGMDGSLVPTREDWIIYKRAIEILLLNHPETVVYDTKKEGALIDYAQLADLEELIKTHGKCEHEKIRKEIEDAPLLINGSNKKNFKKVLYKSQENVEIMQSKAQRLITMCEKICMEAQDTEWKATTVQEISAINSWMDEQIEMELIVSFIESETEDLAEELLVYSGDAKQDEYNTYLYLKQYYQYILKGLNDVKKHMDKYQEESV